jgi:hypothetical protein
MGAAPSRLLLDPQRLCWPLPLPRLAAAGHWARLLCGGEHREKRVLRPWSVAHRCSTQRRLPSLPKLQDRRLEARLPLQGCHERQPSLAQTAARARAAGREVTWSAWALVAALEVHEAGEQEAPATAVEATQLEVDMAEREEAAGHRMAGTGRLPQPTDLAPSRCTRCSGGKSWSDEERTERCTAACTCRPAAPSL